MYAANGKIKPLVPGMKVRKGDPLSKGPINPHELLEQTDMEHVQRYMSDELYKLYNKEGIPASPFRTDDWPLFDAANYVPKDQPKPQTTPDYQPTPLKRPTMTQ